MNYSLTNVVVLKKRSLLVNTSAIILSLTISQTPRRYAYIILKHTMHSMASAVLCQQKTPQLKHVLNIPSNVSLT